MSTKRCGIEGSWETASLVAVELNRDLAPAEEGTNFMATDCPEDCAGPETSSTKIAVIPFTDLVLVNEGQVCPRYPAGGAGLGRLTIKHIL